MARPGWAVNLIQYQEGQVTEGNTNTVTAKLCKTQNDISNEIKHNSVNTFQEYYHIILFKDRHPQYIRKC